MGVEIQKVICVGISTENLIDSMCFYLKFSQVNVSISNFSEVCMFCDDDGLKLVPESM